jgi:Cu-Zn family superoxide dismutase
MMFRTLNFILAASLFSVATLSAVEAAVTTKAFAKISPTSDQKVTGNVTFETVDKGVRIVADFKGLTPGLHGFHVHEKGDCSAHDGSSAGGHYNPSGKKHGGPNDAERHAGDFGNVEADADGNAQYERIDTVITLDGVDSIIGKSIVIHADPDDLKSQPAGNSGARIGCGLIEAN